MLFFGKKKPAVQTKEDRDIIEQNSKAVNALIVLAGSNVDMVKQLKALQESLKYLIADEKSKIIDYDKKIRNKLGDLRIALTKADGEYSVKADDIISDIKLIIADRNENL